MSAQCDWSQMGATELIQFIFCAQLLSYQCDWAQMSANFNMLKFVLICAHGAKWAQNVRKWAQTIATERNYLRWFALRNLYGSWAHLSATERNSLWNWAELSATLRYLSANLGILAHLSANSAPSFANVRRNCSSSAHLPIYLATNIMSVVHSLTFYNSFSSSSWLKLNGIFRNAFHISIWLTYTLSIIGPANRIRNGIFKPALTWSNPWPITPATHVKWPPSSNYIV